MTLLVQPDNRTIGWCDPTFDEVWARLRMRKSPPRHWVIVRGEQFWGHDGWTTDRSRVTRFSDEETAWMIGECYQDGSVTVQRIFTP